jgi:hypothetical protein
MAAKKKTVDEYIDELKKMVELRTGKAFDPWLLPQLRATAMGMMMLDKIQDKLADSEITILMTGSMGQQKTEVNPLLDKYINFQRTLISQFQALGLNYNTAKGKVGGAAGDDGEDDDPVLAALTKK